MSGLLAVFPAHKAGLSLEHNQHKTLYEKPEDWIADNEWCDWESEEAKQQAIDTGEIWTLQWYPETPVGFCAVAAPTLEELLRLASDDS
tara:strand:+ start:4189 stop:4455 length:267 start_codon:yes stop_codon:yes gene_type:complete